MAVPATEAATSVPSSTQTASSNLPTNASTVSFNGRKFALQARDSRILHLGVVAGAITVGLIFLNRPGTAALVLLGGFGFCIKQLCCNGRVESRVGSGAVRAGVVPPQATPAAVVAEVDNEVANNIGSSGSNAPAPTPVSPVLPKVDEEEEETENVDSKDVKRGRSGSIDSSGEAEGDEEKGDVENANSESVKRGRSDSVGSSGEAEGDEETEEADSGHVNRGRSHSMDTSAGDVSERTDALNDESASPQPPLTPRASEADHISPSDSGGKQAPAAAAEALL